MAIWTAAKICAHARSVAKTPGYLTQSGELLNLVLNDLAETYDFDVAKGEQNFLFNPGLTQTINGAIVYGGPYPLAADFLRRVDDKSIFWTNVGVPYPLIPISLAEFDMTVQQAGMLSYPYFGATDMSQSPPVLWVYPPPSGAYPVTVRYFRQMPEIPSAEASATVPWFPNSAYLKTRLAGELMALADDTRWEKFLGDGPEGAQGILNRYLKRKDDADTPPQTVQMDRRRFGNASFAALPNTKDVGW